MTGSWQSYPYLWKREHTENRKDNIINTRVGQTIRRLYNRPIIGRWVVTDLTGLICKVVCIQTFLWNINNVCYTGYICYYQPFTSLLNQNWTATGKDSYSFYNAYQGIKKYLLHYSTFESKSGTCKSEVTAKLI